ncbi:MAG: extracellular solute-binding protein [Erysipelotrichaceae bacterium]|nr:extracellular solute-binding protein [Erysipelotrichaceae bacterium]
MRKKLSLFTTMTAASVLLLSGCGAKKPQIYFWTGFGTSITDSLTRLISQYQQDNDEYEIVLETDGGGYDSLQRKIGLSVTSETYPHLAVGYPDHMAGYIGFNILQPLDEFIEAEGPAFIEDFHQDYLVENQSLETDREGNQLTWGLPFNKSTEVMVANKTFLDYVQTFDASIVTPETWEEAEVVGEKILKVMKDNDLYGKEVNHGDKILNLNFKEEEFRPFSWDSTANMFITIVREWGGTYTKADSWQRGTYQFDSAETREALTFFKGLADAKIMGVPQNWGESSYSSIPFNANKTVFTISSSAGVKYNVPKLLDEKYNFEITINPIPYHEGATPMVISQGTNLLMFKKGDEAEQAFVWDFIKYLTTEVNDVFGLENAYYPVTKSMLNSQTYVDFLSNVEGKPADERAVVDAARVNAEVYDAPGSEWRKFVDPGFVRSNVIREHVGNIIPAIFVNNSSVEAALKTATDILAEFAPK